jgi:PAS domain S-box-containing protein
MARQRRTVSPVTTSPPPDPGARPGDVIDLIADGLALVDGDGIILFVNRPLGELLGYEPSELAGKPIELLVPMARRAEHRGDRETFGVDPAPRRMGRSDLDIEAQHADGRRIPVDIQLTPLPNTTMIAATVRDMTRERQAAADQAIQRLDLIATIRRNEQMIAYYDVMLQQLFALGTHLEAAAHRDRSGGSGRFLQAASVVDELIEITRSQAFGRR